MISIVQYSICPNWGLLYSESADTFQDLASVPIGIEEFQSREQPRPREAKK